MSVRSYEVGFEDGLKNTRSCSTWEFEEDELDYNAGYEAGYNEVRGIYRACTCGSGVHWACCNANSSFCG